MGKKKSLGHNPLAYSMSRHASFDFIGSHKEEEEEHGTQPEHQEEHEEQTAKVTASYYLEEPLVNKIKVVANKKEISYSALVNALLKQSLKTEPN